MGLQGALYTGVSALSATGEAMNVIGNNLANSNTTAYKSSRTLFSDLLASKVASSSGTSQVGTGVGLATVDTIFSQGGFSPTESSTDLAIEGDGFFKVKDPNTGSEAYTRAGGFTFNANGYFVNPQGYRVQGYAVDGDGNAIGTMQDIQTDLNGSVAAKQTGSATFNTNLNAGAQTISAAFDPADSSTYNFSSSINVYDSLGQAHLMNVYFTKTGNNQWDYNLTVPTPDVDAAATSGLTNVGSGTLYFNSDGQLLDGNGGSPVDSLTLSGAASSLTWANGANQAQTIDVSLGLSQYAGQSELVSKNQDGYSSGALSGIEVDQKGHIIGSYSNGQSRTLAQLGLGKFANNSGLAQVGNSLYEVTNASGLPAVGTPGSGVGSIRSNALEQSTVDIAKEFTKMITTQRAYQANARTITTSDEMLQEVVNLKR